MMRVRPSMVLAFFALCFALLLVASFRPVAFIWVVFLLGPFPFSALIESPSVATPMGEIQITALIVFAILSGTVVAMAINLRAVARQIGRYSLFIAFIVYCAISMTWASDVSMALRMLLKLATPLLFSMLVAATVIRYGPRPVANAVVTSGVVYAALATVSWLLGWGNSGFFTYPGTAASVSSGHSLTPFAVLLADAAYMPSLGRVLLVSLIGGTIVAGFTRITIGAMFAAAAVILFNRAKGLVRAGVLVAGALGFVALFTFVDVFRRRMFLEKADAISFASVLENPEQAIVAIGGSGRFAAWRMSLDRLFTPHPFEGSGIGATQSLFYSSWSGSSAVHSEVVRLLCDVGMIGFTLYVLAWLQLLWGAARGWRRTPDPGIRSMKLAAIGSIVAYLVFLSTDNGLDYVAQMGVFVFGVTGAAIGLTDARAVRARHSKRRIFGVADRVLSTSRDRRLAH